MQGLIEHGVVRKRCRDCLRVALLYPAVYSAAVHSLAYQNLYYMLNSLAYVVAERFVAHSMAGLEPPPRSLETGAPLTDFDLILVPVSYELDYVTLARMLLAAGLEPLRSSRRDAPPVVVGGPVPSMNPVPALQLADMVLLGEAEPTVPLLAEEAYARDPWGALEALACRPGFLAPGCSRVRKAVARSLDSAPHSVVQFRVPGSGEPWGEAYMVEASRGCPHMCRFCMESHFLLPTRHRSAEKILELIERGVEANRVSKVAFYALSFFDHPAGDKLLEETVHGMGLEATIGSLRADQLDEHRLQLLAEAGQRHVSIAPETLSPRLCRAIGKCIGPDTVEEVSVAAWKQGLRVKLYLMLGLPGERDEDIKGYAEKLRSLAAKAPPRREALRVSVNPLVPKPHTPLQWHPLIDRRSYEARLRILRHASSKVASIEGLSYRYAYAQAVVARGDEKIGKAIVEWARLGGKLGQLRRAAKKAGADPDLYAYRPLEAGAPWHSLVDLMIPVAALRRAYEASLSTL